MIKCLITCIDFRQKYVQSLGGGDALGVFDNIIDVTRLIFPDRGAFEFNDGIVSDRVIKPDSISEFENVLKKIAPDLVLIFRPQSFPLTKFVYENVSQIGATWGVLSNKKTLRDPLNVLDLKRRLKCLYYKLGSKKFHADFIMTNSLMENVDILKKIKFDKVITVPHMDAVIPNRQVLAHAKNERVGVFLDQYLPFHLEIQRKRGIYIRPGEYYQEVRSFLNFAKEKYSLDKVIFCQHPNSLGEEVGFLKGLECVKNETQRAVSNADMVFMHFSNSGSFAIQGNKPIICFSLGCMPHGLCETIHEKSEKIGADYIHFEHNEVRTHVKRYWFNKRLRVFLFKLNYSANGKSPLQVIDEMK